MLGCLLYALPIAKEAEILREEQRLGNSYLMGFGEFVSATSETVTVSRNGEQEYWDHKFVILTETLEDAENIYNSWTQNLDNFDLRSW